MGNQEEAPGQDTDAQSEIQLAQLVESTNIAEKLDEETLRKISQQVSDGFEYDLRSRMDWEKRLDEWTTLALQTKEEKSFPWRNASNVKYPLLSTAAMQFNARAYPSLIPATGDIVKSEVLGVDPDGQKLEQGKRISTFMSYQLLHEMDGWEEDMDKLLIMLPIVGTLFKKTYFNSVTKKNVSELILPKDLVVNYWAKSLDDAERISQVLLLNKRMVKERQMSKIYRDVELGEPIMVLPQNVKETVQNDETMPYQIIEQHTYYDIDGDGYTEPYIVVFERQSKEILRIAARYDEDTIYMGEDGKLQKICPIQYYTKFSFIPNPDGSFYDIGFGLLLEPLNESVNTLLNQIIDAGTLNNLQGGFLGKGLKLKMGEQQWKPGEWKTLNTTADDLRKQIVPLPTKEPSKVLMELATTLITSGKELASVAEIFVGKMPGQNTPATTTMATIEQGMKVFTAVYKRIYRSLKEEYRKLFRLNKIYLDQQEYALLSGPQIQQNDFDEEGHRVCPAADPSTPTQTEKLMKAQGLLELMPMAPGMLDPVQVITRVLEAQEQPSYQQLFTQQVQQTGQYQPPSDPKTQEIQMKSQAEQQKSQQKQQELEFKSSLDARDQQFQQAMQAQAQNHELQIKEIEARLTAVMHLHNERSKMAIQAAQAGQKMVIADQQHTQKMQHQEELTKSKIQQTKMSSKAGKNTQ